MRIKTADGHEADLRVLHGLLARDDLSPWQRERIDAQIAAIRTGARGESDVAYHLDFSLRDNPDTHVIHDLRIEVDGRVAQIDHVVVSRYRFVYALETKNLNANLNCNERGEWTAWYGPRGRARPQAIASPVEQAKRHAAVLEAWFRAAGIGDLEGVQGVVIVASNAHVGRRSAEADREVPVIRADLFKRWWETDRNIGSPLRGLFLLAGRMSRKQLDEVCARLAASHSPIERDWAAQFGVRPAPPRAPVRRPPLPPSLPGRPMRAAGVDALMTALGPVEFKPVGNGRLALRHADVPGLAELVAEAARAHGTWQNQYRNWLIPSGTLELVWAALQPGRPAAQQADAAQPPPARPLPPSLQPILRVVR